MALNANALLTVAEAESYLDAGDLTDAFVEDLINRASDYCEGGDGANRLLKERAFTTLRLAGQRSPNLRPPATPIKTDATVTITVDGETQTVWRTEADGDPADKDVIVGADVPGSPSFFYRSSGWCEATAGNPFPIVLSYTGGFSPVPGDLKEAALLILENIYRHQKKKTADVAGYGAGPVSPSVSFVSPSLIPMKARHILNAYRIVPL